MNGQHRQLNKNGPFPRVVDGESREFVVITPLGEQFDEPSLQARISEALHEAFPDAGFTVLSTGPRNDEFTIMPVIEERGGIRVSRPPPVDVTDEIATFLANNFATIRAPTRH